MRKHIFVISLKFLDEQLFEFHWVTKHKFLKHGCPQATKSQSLSPTFNPTPTKGHVMSVKCEQSLDELTVHVLLMYHLSTCNIALCCKQDEIKEKIVAAFRGMHVLPAKHSFGKCDRRTDRQTDGRTIDKVIPMCCYASQATQKQADPRTDKQTDERQIPRCPWRGGGIK